MPLFDFICSKCGYHEELLVKHSSDKPVCPACGNLYFQRQLPRFNIIGKSNGSVKSSDHQFTAKKEKIASHECSSNSAEKSKSECSKHVAGCNKDYIDSLIKRLD